MDWQPKTSTACTVRITLVTAALLFKLLARSADGQSLPVTPLPVQSTVSFRAGEVTVKEACSAFGLVSNPDAVRTCLNIPVSLNGGKLDEARQLAEKLVTELSRNGIGHYVHLLMVKFTNQSKFLRVLFAIALGGLRSLAIG